MRPRAALFAACALLTAGTLWLGLAGPSGRILLPPSRPTRTYEEAIARFALLRARDGALVNPVCRSQLMTHGARASRVVVLLHGFTNCPRQFERLGRIAHASGANVILPRLPRHGLRDRMTEALAGLAEQELLNAGVEAVDIATGLGDTVAVVGLSSSAVVAGALAERMPAVDRALLIAPALAPRGVGPAIARRFATLLIAAPNQYIWWDSKARERVGGPTQCYPRFPTHALGEVYRLGFRVSAEARATPPAARAIAIVTSASDRAVDPKAAAALAAEWRRHGAAVTEYTFPESLRVLHDMIDPEQVGARVEVVYPVLVRLLFP